MNNKSFKKGIEEINKVHMTRTEKSAMVESIIYPTTLMHQHPSSAVRSPLWMVKSRWDIYTFGIWIQNNRKWSYGMAAVLVLCLSTGGVAFAAQDSLPGDVLYPVKVDVTEPLQSALTFSAEAKAQLAADLAVERMKEALALASKDELDQTKQRQIQSLFDAHTAALASDLVSVSKADPAKAKDIASKFQASMMAQASALESIASVPTAEAAYEASSSAGTVVVPIVNNGDRGNISPADHKEGSGKGVSEDSSSRSHNSVAPAPVVAPVDVSASTIASTTAPTTDSTSTTQNSLPIKVIYAPISPGTSTEDHAAGQPVIRSAQENSSAKALSEAAKHAADTISPPADGTVDGKWAAGHGPDKADKPDVPKPDNAGSLDSQSVHGRSKDGHDH
ncbi:MAG: hypothetical protein KGI49_02825 [Patescibacteria group bacterium]|nr:hypothetical protein [Patescibacteria group bacterium]